MAHSPSTDEASRVSGRPLSPGMPQAGREERAAGPLGVSSRLFSGSLCIVHPVFRFSAELWGTNLETEMRSCALERGQRAGRLPNVCLQHAITSAQLQTAFPRKETPRMKLCRRQGLGPPQH